MFQSVSIQTLNDLMKFNNNAKLFEISDTSETSEASETSRTYIKFGDIKIDVTDFPMPYEIQSCCLHVRNCIYWAHNETEYLIVLDTEEYDGHTGSGDNVLYITIYNITKQKMCLSKKLGTCCDFSVLPTHNSILLYMSKTLGTCDHYHSNSSDWEVYCDIQKITIDQNNNFVFQDVNNDDIVETGYLTFGLKLFSISHIALNLDGVVLDLDEQKELIDSNELFYLYMDEHYIYYHSLDCSKFYKFNIILGELEL